MVSMLKEDNLKKILEGDDEDSKTFFEYVKDDFQDYLEGKRYSFSAYNKRYSNIQKEISKIKENSPNLLEILENKNATNLDIDEVKALMKIRELEEDLYVIEKEICFKLGIKELLKMFL